MTSVLHALVYRQLPVPDPSGLLSFNTYDERGRERYVPYLAVRPIIEAGPFKSVCGYNGGGVTTAQVDGAPLMSLYAFVSGGCFDTFGVQPLIGRAISDADAPISRPGNKVAVISHRFWTRMFGADPAVLGRRFRAESAELTVIGVMPEGFGGLHVDTAVDFYVPPDSIIPAPPERRPVASPFVVRLKDGVTLEQARQQMAALWPRIKPSVIGNVAGTVEGASLFGDDIRFAPIGTGISSMRRTYAPAFEMMAALTALLLLLMCVNVGGLLLTRLSSRGNELWVRLALGGSRIRIAQQMLIEGLVLSIAGTTVAMPLAFAMVAPIDAFMPQNRIQRTLELTPDTTVLMFTAIVGVAAGLLITSLPIWLALRRQAVTPLSWDRTVAPAMSWWSRSLMVSQVAVSVTILIGAGLLVRSLYLLQRVDIGVKTANVIDVDLFPLPGARSANVSGRYPAMLERIAALPGVESVGMSQAFPRQRLPPSTPVSFVGESGHDVISSGDSVSPGFFETIGVPLLAGRAFDWADTRTSTRICIVTESLARALRADGDVLDRHIRYGTLRDRQDLTIVGIVANINHGNLRIEQPPLVFVPPVLTGGSFAAPNVLIKSTRGIDAMAPAIREIVGDGGREYAREIITLDDLFARAPSSERLSATLAGFTGILAILLAAIGIHGVLAYAVSQRTREIGVRLAVGANPGVVARAVMREGAALTLAGVAIGVPIAFFAARTLRSLLYGVSETDAMTFAAAAAFVVMIGVVAGIAPARRAARVDPATALRGE